MQGGWKVKTHLDVGDGITKCGRRWRRYDEAEGTEYISLNALDDLSYVDCKKCQEAEGK